MSKPEPTRYRTTNWKSYNDALKRMRRLRPIDFRLAPIDTGES